MINRLTPAIHAGKLAPVDRAALLLDNYALAKAGLTPLESVVSILRALENETSSIVWGAMAGVFNGFYILMEQLYGDNGKGKRSDVSSFFVCLFLFSSTSTAPASASASAYPPLSCI
jgi:hypothetical protein